MDAFLPASPSHFLSVALRFCSNAILGFSPCLQPQQEIPLLLLLTPSSQNAHCSTHRVHAQQPGSKLWDEGLSQGSNSITLLQYHVKLLLISGALRKRHLASPMILLFQASGKLKILILEAFDHNPHSTTEKHD
jgi:hypothetical protein